MRAHRLPYRQPSTDVLLRTVYRNGSVVVGWYSADRAEHLTTRYSKQRYLRNGRVEFYLEAVEPVALKSK